MAYSGESWKRDGEEEEEEEEELDESNYIFQKDAVTFAIDVSPTMLTPPPSSDHKKAEKDSPTQAAIKCAHQIMQQRIISNSKDMMGVLLFGTEQSKFQQEEGGRSGNLAYPHCYLLSDLNVPAAEDVKALREIVADDEVAGEILAPSSEPVSMSNMLFCANQIFTTRAPNFGSRRLFIITDNDDPHSRDKKARSQAAVRAKDLYDLGVVIELFPISHTNHEFDRTKFYDDIIYRDPYQEEALSVAHTNLKAVSGDGISLLNNLISDINSKQVAKRTLFSNLPFEIGPGFKISVKGYNLLQKQAPARSCFIYAGGEEKQIAVGESTRIEEDTACPVQKDDIKKAYKFGGTQIVFTEEEQRKLKSFGPPLLRIIGFKPQSMLKIWHAVKKATFIFPSEEGYVGSTRVFAALWKKLVNDKKMGVAWYIARANATPLLVAILPSEERIDDTTNAQLIPAGLWLYPLPFADDIRDIPEPPKQRVPDALVTKEWQAPGVLIDEMEKVVKQLQLPKAVYDPSKYPNPSLQWFYKILQALALEDEIPTQPEDKTIPKFRQINKRAGEYINTWGQILDEQYRAYEKSTGVPANINGSKLKRGSENDNGPRSKKVKLEKGSLDSMSVDDLKNAIQLDTLRKFTAAEMKGWLMSKGLATSGKKDDLMERIEQWAEDN